MTYNSENDVEDWSRSIASVIVDELYSAAMLSEDNMEKAHAVVQQQLAESLLRLLGKLTDSARN